jgi:large subunit ribosomal protein L5
MYEFLERLVLTALPRVREFRGFSSKDFDGRGNFSFGIKEQIVFPEIDYDSVQKIRGLNVTIVTSATSNLEAQALLEGFHLPFLAS